MCGSLLHWDRMPNTSTLKEERLILLIVCRGFRPALAESKAGGRAWWRRVAQDMVARKWNREAAGRELNPSGSGPSDLFLPPKAHLLRASQLFCTSCPYDQVTIHKPCLGLQRTNMCKP